MTEKDANKKPTEPDPKDVSAGGAAPQNVIGTDARSTQPSQAEREIDPNDGIAAGGIPPRQATADPGHPATDATESKPTTCDLPVSSLDVAAGGQAPGQHQATGPQNTFGNESESKQPNLVEPGTDPNDNVAAGTIAPLKAHLADAGRTPKIISTPLDPQALGPGVDAIDPSDASQGDDVSAGGAAPAPHLDTGPDQAKDPSLKVRVNAAALTAPDQNHMLDA
ncbi:MAG: hypothetical protein ACYSUA_12310 [Planctomycetota bacterium]|jgi:hypothetical protein